MPGKIANISLLIVDDEKLISKLVGDVLRRLGFQQVTAANNGRAAIDYLLQKPFDLVITDWRMHDMDGLDLLRFIRLSPHSPNPRLPVILLTGNTEWHEVLLARDSGVTEYIAKPFSARQLVERIRSVIEKPRSFVEAPGFKGPDRRRQVKPPADGVEKRRSAA